MLALNCKSNISTNAFIFRLLYKKLQFGHLNHSPPKLSQLALLASGSGAKRANQRIEISAFVLFYINTTFKFINYAESTNLVSQKRFYDAALHGRSSFTTLKQIFYQLSVYIARVFSRNFFDWPDNFFRSLQKNLSWLIWIIKKQCGSVSGKKSIVPKTAHQSNPNEMNLLWFEFFCSGSPYWFDIDANCEHTSDCILIQLFIFIYLLNSLVFFSYFERSQRSNFNRFGTWNMHIIRESPKLIVQFNASFILCAVLFTADTFLMWNSIKFLWITSTATFYHGFHTQCILLCERTKFMAALE